MRVCCEPYQAPRLLSGWRQAGRLHCLWHTYVPEMKQKLLTAGDRDSNESCQVGAAGKRGWRAPFAIQLVFPIAVVVFVSLSFDRKLNPQPGRNRDLLRLSSASGTAPLDIPLHARMTDAASVAFCVLKRFSGSCCLLRLKTFRYLLFKHAWKDKRHFWEEANVLLFPQVHGALYLIWNNAPIFIAMTNVNFPAPPGKFFNFLIRRPLTSNLIQI